MRGGFIFKFVFGIILYFTASPVVLAQFGQDTQNITATPIIEWEKRQDIDDRLQPLGDDLMGDMIDPHTGSIVFEHTDVSLLGNFALDVSIRRQRSQGLPYHYSVDVEFGDWELQVPRIETITAYNSRWRTEKNRCSEPFTYNFQSVTPPSFLDSVQLFGTTITQDAPTSHAYQYSSGVNMDIPGYGSQQLLYAFNNNFAPSDADYVTKDGWHLKCSSAPASDGGESFTAYAPNGTVYEFTSHVEHRYKDQGFRAYHTVHYHRYKSVLSATKVTDVNGNEVTYDYTPDGRLTKIEASDGRVITLEYDSGSALIKRVKAGNRQWTYDYGVNKHVVDYWETSNGYAPGNQVLRMVEQPDGLAWQFDLDGMTAEPAPAEDCIAPFALLFIDHPYGARGTFALAQKRHRPSLNLFTRSYEFCPIQNGHEGGTETAPVGSLDPPPERLLMVPSISVTSKSISNEPLGQAISSWSYEYEEDEDELGSSANDPTNWTRVTDAVGRVTQYYHNWSNSENGGKLSKKEVYESATAQTPIETSTYEYEEEQRAGGTYFYSPDLSPSTDPRVPVRRNGQSVSRDGDSYSQILEYVTGHHDPNYSYGRPVKLTLSSSFDAEPRQYDVVYKHLSSPWITGLIETVHFNDRLATNYVYDDWGRKTSQSVYGQLQGTFEYSTIFGEKGAVKKVTDAINRSYAYENYKGGIPQTIIRADSTVEEQEVEDNGWIASQTDARGYRTSYARDNMGRLKRISPSAVEIGLSPTILNYFFNSEITQFIDKGFERQQIKYDSLLRPTRETTVVRPTEASQTPLTYVTATQYDGLGRVSFKSLPYETENLEDGTAYEYDALGRMTREYSTIDSGVQTTYEYLQNNCTRVTDGEGHATTTCKNGYGGPGGGEVVSITQPEGIVTTLAYNDFGDLLSVNQTGPQGGNQTQEYFYDDHRRLCRSYAAERGHNLYAYDDAGQMTSYAKGITGVINGCPVPSGPSLVTLNYDDLGRLKTTDYADPNTPDIWRDYDANGNITKVYRGQIGGETCQTSTPNVNCWFYGYDEYNRLKFQDLQIDDRSFEMKYYYNGYGYMYRQTLPTGRQILQSLDGAGRLLGIGWGGAQAAAVAEVMLVTALAVAVQQQLSKKTPYLQVLVQVLLVLFMGKLEMSKKPLQHSWEASTEGGLVKI